MWENFIEKLAQNLFPCSPVSRSKMWERKRRMKLKRLTRTSALILLLLMVIGCLSVTIAVILQMRMVEQHLVLTVGDFEVYADEACTTVLTSVDWGAQVSPYYAGRSIYLKNLGGVPLYISWNVTVIPANVTLITKWDSTAWLPDTRMKLLPNQSSGQRVALDLTVAGEIVAGTYAWTQTFIGDQWA